MLPGHSGEAKEEGVNEAHTGHRHRHPEGLVPGVWRAGSHLLIPHIGEFAVDGH